MKNNNQEVIRRLSGRSLKQSRVRNRIAVLAIALTSLLFTVVFSFAFGMAQIAQEETMREVGGRMHAGLKHVTQEQMEKTIQSAEIKDFAWNIQIGFVDNSIFRQGELRYTPFEKELENSFIMLREGTMPLKEKDLVADTIILEELGVEKKLGAEVPITFNFMGKEYNEVFTLCGWYEGDYIGHASQLYVSEAYWEKLRDGRTDEEFEAWGEKNPEDEGMGLYNVNLMFANAKNIEEHVRAVIEEAGYVPEKEIEYGVNWAYMQNRTEALDPLSIAVGAAAVLIIIVMGYLIIHNIFQISILSDIRFYGLLKTIGTTGKQLKKLVRRQAWVLSAAGIPIGLVLGFVICKLLFPVATGYLDLRGMEVSLSFDPWIFVFGIVFSLITVWMSCRKPSRIAAKVSPVEAVRYTEGKTGKRKQKKSVSGTRISRMAFANLGRNKGKTAAVILSMTFSIVLLSLVMTAMNSFRLDSYLEARIMGDFMLGNVNFTGNTTDYDYTIDEDYIARADEQKGIISKDEIWQKRSGVKLYLEGEAVKRFASLDERGRVNDEEKYGKSRNEIEKIKKGEWGITTAQYAYTPELLEKISVLEGSFDAEKFQSGKYVFVTEFYGREHEAESLYRPGEHLKVRMLTENSGGEALEEDDQGNPLYFDYTNVLEKEYEVMAVVSIPESMKAEGIFSNSIEIVLPLADVQQQAQYQVSDRLAVSYQVEKEDQAAFEAFLKDYTEYVNPKMGYLSTDLLRQQFSGMIRSISMMGIVLAVVIAVVGILNFLNAILTGIQSRRREFAVLQSIGLTGMQLKQLLLYEGLFYAMISGLISIVLGSVLGYWVIGSLNNLIRFFEYHYTALPYLIMLPVFAAVSLAIPYFACRQMMKTSVVDRLRD
ncbi:MAG: ABC transporter permease [Lachnospiraceae bacterium]|nr:ABC transporter permease [Lachnospiraceae bacterium]